MLVGAFFGAQLLGEGEVRRRIACAVVIAVGVLMIALGKNVPCASREVRKRTCLLR